MYYPEVEALIKARSGAARVVVFDHTLRSGSEAEREEKLRPRAGAFRAQRLHRMVRAAARARDHGRRGRGAARAPLRHHPGVARVRRCDRADPREPARARRRAQRRARGPARRRAALSAPRRADLPPEVQPEPPLVLLSRAARATRRSCSRSTTRRRTAARASRRTPRSTIPPRRPMRRRGRASRRARLAFF